MLQANLTGRFRKKITIQQATETANSFGELSVTWTTYKIVWASVEPLSGKEYYESQKINSDKAVKIIIRYVSGLTPKMRVLWNSRVFDIQSILNIREQNRQIQLMCLERD